MSTDWLEGAAQRYKESGATFANSISPLETSLDYGIQQNADSRAKLSKSAEDVGASMSLAERNEEEINRAARLKEIRKSLLTTPVLQSMFSDPDKAALLHDDTEAMAVLEEKSFKLRNQEIIENRRKAPERVVKAIGTSITAATFGLSEMFYRIPETIGRGLDAANKFIGIVNPTAMKWKDILGGDEYGPSAVARNQASAANYINNTEEGVRLQEKARFADAAFDKALDGDFGDLAVVFTDVEALAGFVSQAIPSLAASYLSGGSLTVIATMEALEVSADAAEFEERTGQEIDPIAFTQAFVQVGLINGFLEKLGMEKVFKNFGKTKLSGFIRGAISEGGTEGLQALDTNVAIWAAYNREKDLTGGILPGMIGGMGAGGGGGILSAMGQASGPGSVYAKELAEAQKALDSFVNLNEAVDAVLNTKTLTRKKELIKEHLEGVLGTDAEVHIPADVANTLFQNELLNEMPDDIKNDIKEAIETGADVAIRTSDYLTYLSEHHEEISESLRNDLDGMTAQEANEFVDADQEAQLYEKADEILNTIDVENEFQLSADKVSEAVKSQLTQFTPETAEQYASLHKAFSIVMADRLGITPEQVYERFGLKVGKTEMESYNQSGLVVAAKTESGDIVSGQAGQIHAQLIDSLKGQTFDFGFSDSEGKYYTRQEALSLVQETQPDFQSEKRMDELDSQDLYQDERGAISFQKDGAIIGLLENADLSTFLHESGHFFFEAYKEFANDSPEINADMSALLKFVGVKDLETWNGMTLDQRRKGHEKVARGFESYLFEGKAPSIELEGLFSRFKAWLVGVYKNLRNLNVELTDEVRQVFDRMLATEEQIREKSVAAGYGLLFEEGDFSTPEEYLEYQNLNEQQKVVANAELLKRSMKDMKWLSRAKSKALREAQRAAKDKRQTVYDQVKDEVDKEPVYRAEMLIKRGIYVDEEGVAHKVGSHKLGVTKQVKPSHDSLYVFLKRAGGINISNEKGLAKILLPYNKDRTEFGLAGIAQQTKGLNLSAAAELATGEGYISLDINGNVDEGALYDILTMEDAGRGAYTAEGQEEQAQIDFGEKVSEEMGEDDKLRRLHGMTKEGGVSADLIADQYSEWGFTSGEHLIEALLSREAKSERISLLTDDRMLELYGDINSKEALERAAEEAVHNKAHIRFLHTEFKAAAKSAGINNISAKAAKAYAQKAMAKKRLRDIKPNQYKVAARRAGKAAEKAMMEGDRTSAAEHKRAQLLSTHFYREAIKSREQSEKFLKYFKKLLTRKGMSKIGIEYQDQINALLESKEFKTVTNKELENRQSMLEWINAQTELGFEPIVDPAALDKANHKNYRDMTFNEMQLLHDQVSNIEHLGKAKSKFLQLKDKRAFKVVIESAIKSLNENSDGKITERGSPTSVFGKMNKFQKRMRLTHRKLASLIREMDGGKDMGEMWNIFTRGMSESGDNQAEMTMEDAQALQELFKPVLGDINKGGIPFNITSKRHIIPGTDLSMTKEATYMFVMNMGNAGNKQRLLSGGVGSGAITEQQAQAIIDSLSKQEMDFVQGILDYIETKKPLIKEQELRLTGVEPVWVEAEPIVTKHGTYRGGYFPVRTDTDLSTRASEDAAFNSRAGMSGSHGRFGTRHSHIKERAEEVKNRPILLTFNAISQHLQEVNHRLAYQDWLVDVGRAIKSLDGAMRENHGAGVVQEIRDTVRDISLGDQASSGEFEKLINHFRVGATIVGLGWRFSTALIQPAGLSNSWARIGTKWTLYGVNRYLSHPIESTKEAHEKSKMMRTRAITMQREVTEVLNTIRAGQTHANFKASMFYMIQKMQMTVDVPTWHAAYQKSLAEQQYETAQNQSQRDEIDAKAVAVADQTVKDTQASGLIGDLARIQRGGPLQKMFTNFYSYFAATYNLNAEAIGKFQRGGIKNFPAMVIDLMIINTIPALFSMILHEGLKGECDFEAECLAEKLGEEQVSFLLGLTVPTRELGKGIPAFFGMDTYDYKGPAGLAPFADLYQLQVQAAQGEADYSFYRALSQVSGALLHMPTGQAFQTFSGLMAVVDGDVEGSEIVPALLAGPPK